MSAIELTPNASQPSISLNNCHRVVVGNNFNFTIMADHPSRDSSAIPIENEILPETEAISKMMRSKEKISDALLDYISSSFGKRWRELTILLKISELDVDRMEIDYKDTYGIKEVRKCCIRFEAQIIILLQLF